jgi:hypothetical protein
MPTGTLPDAPHHTALQAVTTSDCMASLLVPAPHPLKALPIIYTGNICSLSAFLKDLTDFL